MHRHPPIQLDIRAGVATLTLSRAQQHNVIDAEWIDTLQRHVDLLQTHDDLRCVLLQAQGSMFCVGADVKDMAAHATRLESHIDALIRPAHRAVLGLSSLPVPVVCRLCGTAAGGGASLALACDVIVAARSARLVFAYPQLGTTSDMGLSHALRARLGSKRALSVFLLSDRIDMAQAHQLGLVDVVVDDVDVTDAVQGIVQRLSTVAAGAAKALFLHDAPADLEAQLERERHTFMQCARTQAFRESVRAFAAR